MDRHRGPAAEAGEIRVCVRASSVSQFECEIREGAFTILTGRRFPMIAGHDVAGEVEALGEGAERFRRGDRVFAMRKAFSSGGQGVLAVVPESSAALVPEGVSTENAGVVPVSALAAWQALHELGHLASGQRVLINGVVERTYPITEIAAAHTESAAGRVRGKIAVAMP